MMRVSMNSVGRIVCRTLAPLCAAMLLAGCANAVKTYPTVHTAKINGPNARQSTSVSKGQTLTVGLPTQGGSTHGWRLTPASAENNMLAFQSRSAQRDRTNQRMANSGEPAWDVFVFRARRSGETSIDFVYDCLGSASPSEPQRFQLNVAVIKPQKKSDAAETSIATAESSN